MSSESSGPSPNSTSPVLGILHGGVTVSDMERSLRFYHEGLGLPIVIDTIRDAAYLHEALALPFTTLRIVTLSIPRMPGRLIELLEYHGVERKSVQPRPCDPGSGHLCLEVSDADALHARLSALGHVARSGRAVLIDSGVNEGAKFFYVADPDGYWVELLERAAGRRDTA